MESKIAGPLSLGTHQGRTYIPLHILKFPVEWVKLEPTPPCEFALVLNGFEIKEVPSVAGELKMSRVPADLRMGMSGVMNAYMPGSTEYTLNCSRFLDIGIIFEGFVSQPILDETKVKWCAYNVWHDEGDSGADWLFAT